MIHVYIKLTKFARNPLKKMLANRTLLVLMIVVRCTFSDKHILFNNRTQLGGKRRYSSSDSGDHHQMGIGCGSCRMREEIKMRNIEVIKNEILRKMRLQQAPNITGKVLPEIPEHLKRRIDQEWDEMQADQPQFRAGFSVSEEEDEYHLKTEKIITFAQPYPRLRHKANSGVRGGGDVLHFTFTESVTKFHVSNATLFIYLRGTERRPLPDVNLEIFKVQHPGGDSPLSFTRISSRKATQPFGKGGWVEIDLTETVSEWFKNPRENYGFLVNATVNGKRVAVTDASADKGKKVPYVEISTMETKRRIRRQIAFDCDEKTDQSYCCRYPLTVDFEVIGFDFIIAPKRYNAHMCHGECPFLAMQKHVHTHLTQMTMSSNSMPPCCTPRKMSGISMLYFDNQLNVVYGSLPGMVVDRCGCM